MVKKSKIETIEEYLARGGFINKINPVESPKQTEVIRKSIAGSPAIIMSLEEADLFYGEARKGDKPKKTKPTTKIDLSALPEALRIKFINKLKEEAVDGEDYEEELETDDSDDLED